MHKDVGDCLASSLSALPLVASVMAFCRAIEQAVLERSIHTKAGGLSGGLKRRLKLALELLADRNILFLGKSLHCFVSGSCWYISGS